ncbi:MULTISPECIES: PepSY domain-containing protein [Actinomadura]|uniref:PepSY domain-containing protein n=1 Tax=Actinomadura yumaensis TaxID=111807 RepID=A0ABW2CEH3_9ACTN|nr:PepSY domain-containing protein [Actinomadura sp. J1-007]MWK34437.1 peptidase M4 [Actinomadura sp. J1-007]
MKTSLRGLLVAGVGAVALAGGGAAYATASHSGGSGPDRTAAAAAAHADGDARSGERSDGDDARPGRVSLAQAADAVLKAVPGKIEELELDHGRWEADVLAGDGSWRQVVVDAETAAVHGDRVDKEGGENAAELRAAKTDAVGAAKAATRAEPGTVTAVDFEKTSWEVDVTTAENVEHELTVDAGTGRVLSNRVDED